MIISLTMMSKFGFSANRDKYGKDLQEQSANLLGKMRWLRELSQVWLESSKDWKLTSQLWSMYICKTYTHEQRQDNVQLFMCVRICLCTCAFRHLCIYVSVYVCWRDMSVSGFISKRGWREATLFANTKTVSEFVILVPSHIFLSLLFST